MKSDRFVAADKISIPYIDYASFALTSASAGATREAWGGRGGRGGFRVCARATHISRPSLPRRIMRLQPQTAALLGLYRSAVQRLECLDRESNKVQCCTTRSRARLTPPRPSMEGPYYASAMCGVLYYYYNTQIIYANYTQHILSI